MNQIKKSEARNPTQARSSSLEFSNSPAISDNKYSQFQNKIRDKKILIMGLGTLGGGIGATRFFCNAGAKVTVTDLRDKNELKEAIFKLRKLKIRYILGRHRSQDFRNADMIIKGPGVKQNSPYLKIAEKNKVKIDTDIGVFFELCPCSIIGVTGTKGKSTIATIIYELLKTKYKNQVFLAGNIQKSVLDILPKLNEKSLAVLELSSWQLEGLAPHKKSPYFALITNILPDHLNTYGNLKKYFEAKKIIYKYQTSSDTLVLNYDDVKLRILPSQILRRKTLESKIQQYSLNTILRETTAYVKDNDIFYSGQLLCHIEELKIHGQHNLRHILGALTIANAYKIPVAKARRVILQFRGIPSRLELIKIKNGVEYYNDTTATNPDAVVAALDTLKASGPKSIILIAGGVDKNINSNRYKELMRHINNLVKYLVLLPGTATGKIKEIMCLQKIKVPFILVNDMKKAVMWANQNAKTGDIVLLSPGAASFNLFKNEFDRGKQFIKEVAKL